MGDEPGSGDADDGRGDRPTGRSDGLPEVHEDERERRPATGDRDDVPRPDREGIDASEDPATSASERSGREPGAGERYCYGCATVVSEAAELCPACGIRQRAPPRREPPEGQIEVTPERQRELERQASNDLPSTLALALFLPPVAYLELDKPGYAVLNLLTANFLLLGVVVVPYQTYSTIAAARERLRTVGVEGYR